jgi:hypothetical protein
MRLKLAMSSTSARAIVRAAETRPVCASLISVLTSSHCCRLITSSAWYRAAAEAGGRIASSRADHLGASASVVRKSAAAVAVVVSRGSEVILALIAPQTLFTRAAKDGSGAAGGRDAVPDFASDPFGWFWLTPQPTMTTQADARRSHMMERRARRSSDRQRTGDALSADTSAPARRAGRIRPSHREHPARHPPVTGTAKLRP